MTQRTVKARRRHGTRSLDLTIPTKIAEDLGINEGDIFLVEAFEKNGQTGLTYTRIFKQSKPTVGTKQKSS